ncbi:MAG: Holliday junction branch migration protein RuvA [Alphaproteobacteria bacterium]|nr:Holliday junction branch migration protein RuvA [Alphaproteobacteria bacterium]
MIGKLTGTVDMVGDDHVILDVGGVGYIVHCPSSSLSRMHPGDEAVLMIETRLTEESIRLYGFTTAVEREWFRLLQTVQNVGARVALSVLSTLSPQDLQTAIALSDRTAIGRAQGVGPKLATRILSELKDKAPALVFTGADAAGHGPAQGRAGEDALAALLKLGYAQAQAAELVARALKTLGADAPVDAVIREALKAMAR